LNLSMMETNRNRLAAAEDEVKAVKTMHAAGRATLDLLLDAQRRRVEAECAWNRAQVDHARAVARVHWRKGSGLSRRGIVISGE
jgi:hypothetical protein